MSNGKEKVQENNEALKMACKMRLGIIGRPEEEKKEKIEEKEQKLEPIKYEDL